MSNGKHGPNTWKDSNTQIKFYLSQVGGSLWIIDFFNIFCTNALHSGISFYKTSKIFVTESRSA